VKSDDPESESLLEFPCEFPIKIMGRDEPEFRAVAIVVVERHAGKLNDDAIRTSTSTNGNFVSITVTITATSQQQLDDIYRDLTAHDQVLVAL
jgi:putative lipoic acid-binding regulatory protein